MTTTGSRCVPPRVVPDAEGDADGRPPFVDVYARRYRELVQVARLTTGSNALAEELVQDAFAELYRRYETVRKPEAYVQRAVVSRCTSWIRRRVLERRHAEQHRPEPLPPSDPDTVEVLQAVARLSARQRAAVVLRYLVDWSEADVAAALGMRPTAVRSLLARARKQLARDLDALGLHGGQR